jgi:hypothetical protein
MTSCAEPYLAKAGECALAARLTAVLALQLRRLPQQAEALARVCGKISRCAAVLSVAGRASRTMLIPLKDRSAAVPLCRSPLPANKLCKREVSRCRSRMPSRILPLPQAQHSGYRCIARVLGRHRLGIRSRSASLSNENRGHCGENEQYAPQARHSEAVSSVDCVGKTLI